MTKRVFLIVLDSFGIGEMPDAAEFGDEGSNTLKACFSTGKLNVLTLTALITENQPVLTARHSPGSQNAQRARTPRPDTGK